MGRRKVPVPMTINVPVEVRPTEPGSLYGFWEEVGKFGPLTLGRDAATGLHFFIRTGQPDPRKNARGTSLTYTFKMHEVLQAAAQAVVDRHPPRKRKIAP